MVMNKNCSLISHKSRLAAEVGTSRRELSVRAMRPNATYLRNGGKLLTMVAIAALMSSCASVGEMGGSKPPATDTQGASAIDPMDPLFAAPPPDLAVAE